MPQDLYGLETTARPESQQAIDDFIHGFLAYQPKAAGIIAAADADRDGPLVNAYAALLWMFLEHPVAPEKARPYFEKAKAAPGANDRERAVIEIAGHWVDGDVPALLSACDALTDRWPRDLAMLKLAQYHLFNLGDAAGMLRMALKSLPAAEEIAYVHGMVAFGYEQCHLLDRAAQCACAGHRQKGPDIIPNEVICQVFSDFENLLAILTGVSFKMEVPCLGSTDKARRMTCSIAL